MSTLEEEIASLKQVIAEYERDLRNAVTPAEKSEIRGLINARSENLTELLKEKKRADEAAIVITNTASKDI
jgi:site-specific recombinase XerD